MLIETKDLPSPDLDQYLRRYAHLAPLERMRARLQRNADRRLWELLTKTRTELRDRGEADARRSH